MIDQEGSGRLASVTDATSLVCGTVLSNSATSSVLGCRCHKFSVGIHITCVASQEEFVASAVMSNKDFAAVKGQISIALSDTQTPTMAMASNHMCVSTAAA